MNVTVSFNYSYSNWIRNFFLQTKQQRKTKSAYSRSSDQTNPQGSCPGHMYVLNTELSVHRRGKL